jgi:Pyruvate/2-oxoacid:ferredoxin oxidoreductase delta subunit
MIIDLNEVIRPRLQVMDAVLGMEGDGPHAGTPRKIGAVMASADYSAIDVVTARLMSFDPLRIGTIQAAVERGYLQGDLSDVSVVGDDPAALIVPDFQHPSTYSGMSEDGLHSGLLRGLIFYLAREYAPRPEIDEDRCTGCLKCLRSCPKMTIELVHNKAKINYQNCIKCYCCHEMCDSHAISLQRSLTGKVLERISSNALIRQIIIHSR